MSQTVDVFVGDTQRKEVAASLGKLPRGVRFARLMEGSKIVVSRLEALDETLLRQAMDDALPAAIMTNDPGISQALNAVIGALTYTRGHDRAPLFVGPVGAVRRLVLARRHGAEDKLIAHASVDGDTIRVWSCKPRLFVCHRADVRALSKISPEELSRFSISESGSRISWASVDVDLVLDDFREVCDADFAQEQKRTLAADGERYGRAIRALRKERGLKQADVSELSERQIRRIECGQHAPRLETLRKLARAHDMSLKQYLDALAARA